MDCGYLRFIHSNCMFKTSNLIYWYSQEEISQQLLQFNSYFPLPANTDSG